VIASVICRNSTTSDNSREWSQESDEGKVARCFSLINFENLNKVIWSPVLNACDNEVETSDAEHDNHEVSLLVQNLANFKEGWNIFF
jgi:hypothetical protein